MELISEYISEKNKNLNEKNSTIPLPPKVPPGIKISVVLRELKETM